MKEYGLDELIPPIWLSNIGGEGITYKGELITLDKILADAIEQARADEREKIVQVIKDVVNNKLRR